jgi:protease PrsW
VYALMVAGGAANLLGMNADVFAAYDTAIVTGVVFFALYTVPFWWFIRHADRYTSLPTNLVAVAFAWGLLAATYSMAVSANGALGAIYAKAFGQGFALDWGAALSAPFVEELAKGAGLILIIALAPRLVRSAFDGLILGAFIGLGFEVIEDASYVTLGAVTQFGVNQSTVAVQTILVRAAIGPFSHVVYSALFCAGLVYFLGRPDEPVRRGRGLLLMLAGVVSHGVWDSMIALARGNGLATAAVAVLIAAVDIAILVIAFRWTVGRERHWMRDLMAPEVARGVVTEDELDALSGNRKARKAYIQAHEHHRSHIHARDVLHAETDLAAEIAKADGRNTPLVDYARAEVARLRTGEHLQP